MAKFEKISKYENININLPVRKTADSAGYDFEVAEDTLVLPYDELGLDLLSEYVGPEGSRELEPLTLEETAALTKKAESKPTLVPTGIKCQLDPGTYLELSVRSSCPLKYWLILANGVGRIMPTIN
jgi:dUTP pyrophosphatase